MDLVERNRDLYNWWAWSEDDQAQGHVETKLR
jgi:hypothetical protein